MTKVIKEEFEKIMDVKVEDVSLTCDTQLEIFNMEVSRLSRMDDDLFTYEVEVANILCNSKKNNNSKDDDDDMGYDLSDDAFIEWLRSKIFNYKTMDHYTMKALWIYWIRGDDEVELTDDESSDNDDEIAEVDPDLLTKDIMRFNTYEDYKDDWIYGWNKDVPWVDEKPWTDAGVWTKPTPVKHTCKPFNYKTGCSEWPTCSWKDDGYCNGGNLPGAYIIGNQLHYQDYEWYEALEDCKLKDEALRNKAIMEGSIKEDDDESRYEQKRQWNTYTNYDDAYEINHEHNKSKELCEVHEQPVCNIRRYMMIKYSFNDDEEYVAVKEDEYDDLTVTRKEACRAYQEIFQIMDEGWMDIEKEILTKLVEGIFSGILCDLDNSTSNVLIPLDSWTSGLLVYKLPLSVEYGVSTSIGYGVSSSLSNTTYSLIMINTAYPLPLDTAYRSSDKIRMTKVIKEEFEKIMDVKVEDVLLTCDTQLEIFNMEVSRLSIMDDDLFTYEVEVANVPCNSKKNDDSEDDDDDMGYDPSDAAFIE
ncbi:hypothetical protein Tco_1507813 [Tanacetum coccineum]